MKLIHLAVSAAFTTTLIAQTSAAANARFAPADAQVLARIAAPMMWQAKFADTNLAQLMQGTTMAPFLDQFAAGYDQFLEEAGEAGIDRDLLRGLSDAYQGELVIAVKLDVEDLPIAAEDGRTPAMAVSFALTPDGSFDLAGLTESISRSLEEARGNELRDVMVGEHTLRCAITPEMQFSMPTMIDDHMVMILATDLERAAPDMLASEDRHPRITGDAAFAMNVTAEHAIATLIDFIQFQIDSDPTAPPLDMFLLMTHLGLSSLRTFDMSIDADNEDVVVNAGLACAADNRGLLAAFMFDHGRPKILRYLPPDAQSFSCGIMDIGAAYQTIEDIWTSLDGLAPMSFSEVEEMFAETTKVRLREDLIANIGTEIITLTSESTPEFDDDPMMAIGMIEMMATGFAGTCYALSLRDGKAFGDALEKALRSRGLHAARKSDVYQDVKVYRMRLGGLVELEYAVTDDLLLLAPGNDEGSRAQLRSILDARAAPEAALLV